MGSEVPNDPPPDLGGDATEIPAAEPPVKPAKAKKEYRVIQLPSPEQMVQEDFMNNCAVRSIFSGVMGAGLGVVFGIFMGTMDTSVRKLSRNSYNMCVTKNNARAVMRYGQ
jgi:import inner membrane translocase subunit TIM22